MSNGDRRGPAAEMSTQSGDGRMYWIFELKVAAPPPTKVVPAGQVLVKLLELSAASSVLPSSTTS